ncbi:MAG: hypothetical protein AAF711_05545 [Planctomycetota bacterium]
MESNLTKAGWLLLIVSLILLGGAWYVAKFVIGWEFSTPGFIIGGGIGLIGCGAALLNKLGIEIVR